MSLSSGNSITQVLSLFKSDKSTVEHLLPDINKLEK